MNPDERGDIAKTLGTIERHIAQLAQQVDAIGRNIDMLRHEHTRLMSSVGALHAEVGTVKDRIDRHGRRLRSIEEHTQLQRPQSDPDITGQVMIDAALLEAENKRLAQENAQRRDSGIWWRRQTALWLIAGLGALAMLLMTGVGSLVFWLLTKGHP